MAISLATKFQPYTDEIFKNESKKSLLTYVDFSWTGAHTIKVFKINVGEMNDYGRNGPGEGNWSRYGAVKDLDATTEELTLRKDRSFTFAIDKLDNDETAQQLAAASALARQQREVIVPEVDAYTYGIMAANAGTKPAAAGALFQLLSAGAPFQLLSAGALFQLLSAGAVKKVPKKQRALSSHKGLEALFVFGIIILQ